MTAITLRVSDFYDYRVKIVKSIVLCVSSLKHTSAVRNYEPLYILLVFLFFLIFLDFKITGR